MTQRQFTAALVAIGALLLLLLWLANRSPRGKDAPFPSRVAPAPPTRPQTRHMGADTVATAGAPRTPSAATNAETTPTTVPQEEALSDGPTIVSLAKKAADDYRQRAAFPPWSHPLEDGQDPILRDLEVSPILAAGPNGEAPTLVVFPAQRGFEDPEPALLLAYLTDESGQRIAPASIYAKVTTELLQPLAELSYRDDGAGGDSVAGDLIYTAVYQPGEERLPALSQSFLVQVVAVLTDGDERLAATSFLYSNPHAQLTGNYRDSLVDGNLVIETELLVTTAGRFHIEGTLYDAAGDRPLAWAQAASELDEGQHWLPLTFFGTILRAAAVNGPYLLRFVALSTTTAMPNAKNRLAENVYLTAPYEAERFSDQPFGDPDLMNAADRLEQDLSGAALESEIP